MSTPTDAYVAYHAAYDAYRAAYDALVTAYDAYITAEDALEAAGSPRPAIQPPNQQPRKRGNGGHR